MRLAVPVALLLLSCARNSEPATPAKGDRAQPPNADATDRPKTSGDAKTTGSPECKLAIADYLRLREGHNHCVKDEDCAEIYPGPCPQGPHYMHVADDHAALDAAVTEMNRACETAVCEMPRRLPIARCEAGRCERGRRASERGPHTSCWDTQITYMQAGHPYIASSYEHLQGITPLHAVGVPAEGTLRVSTRADCSTCALMVSEHNTGMASLIKGRPFTPVPDDPMEIKPVTSRSPPAGPAQHLEYTVKPGPYFMAIIGGTGQVQYEVELLDSGGAPMVPNLRGRVYTRICED